MIRKSSARVDDSEIIGARMDAQQYNATLLTITDEPYTKEALQQASESYDELLNIRGDGIMFCGHTHHAAVWELSGKGMVRPRLERRFSSPALRNETSTIRIRAGSRYIVNVGSVGYPRNDRCASYAIYDDEAKSISMRRLSFDFKDYVAKMLDHGIRLPRWLFLPPAFA